MSRTLTSATTNALASQLTLPGYLVRISWPTNTVRLTSRSDITWSGNLYSGFGVLPGGLEWRGSAEQGGTLRLDNSSGAYSALGLVSGNAYTVTFLAEDWSGRQDDVRMGLIAHNSSGTKYYGGIIINEVFSKGGPQDWIELMNTASTSIDVSGYTLYASGVLVYTWPAGSIIDPGQLLLTTGLEFSKSQSYRLNTGSGAPVDEVSTPAWQEKSYGRTGAPPYSTWASMVSTPGALNVGQTPIPEFGNFIVPLAIVPIIMIAFRHSKRVEGPPEEE